MIQMIKTRLNSKKIEFSLVLTQHFLSNRKNNQQSLLSYIWYIIHSAKISTREIKSGTVFLLFFPQNYWQETLDTNHA